MCWTSKVAARGNLFLCPAENDLKHEKMAKNKSTVYLGYDDEEITAKQAALLNSCTNKIGGEPVSTSAEQFCSSFHRILRNMSESEYLI